ncbi:MAG: helix-turn-helix transcriptional regulator [Gammaproteobacteria bacterium]|nr:helix-turn-helix transcriptional regulator [Gammaproteobacteria bacterium]
MTNLRLRDLDDIRALGGVALECRTPLELRDELLRRIEDAFAAPSAVFFHFDEHAQGERFRDGFSRGVPADAPALWCQNYQHTDPFVDHFLRHIRSGGERVVISSNIVRNRDYVRTAFYCDFLQPQSVHHIMVSGVMQRSRLTALMGLHRPPQARPFSGEDVLKMNLVLPHLAAAVEKVDLLEGLAARQQVVDILAQDLRCAAVFMLDEKDRVLVANESAVALLQLPADGEPVHAAIPGEIGACCRRLREQMTRDGAERPEFSAGFRTRVGGAEIYGSVRAHRPAPGALRFLVYVDPRPQPVLQPQYLRRYGLSRREVQIVELVSLGLTNARIADTLGISARTVENHLRSIYTKVDVHNRTSLVSQLTREH